MDEAKTSQLAAAFILRNGRPIGVLRLMKLMYLADREAMRRFVFPITFDGIYAMQQGMMLSKTFDLMKREPGTTTNGEWDRLISPPQASRGLNVRQHVTEGDLDSLSRNDLEVIDQVWRQYGGMNIDELVHEVHHGLEEWTEHWQVEHRKTSAVPVPYESLCETLRGMSKEDACDAAREIAYFRRIAEQGEDLRELA